MYTEVGQGRDGAILARDDSTGETTLITPDNAQAMRAFGTLKSEPIAPQGPQMSQAPSMAGAYTGAPQAPLPPAPKATPAPTQQPRPPSGGRAAGLGNLPLLQGQQKAPQPAATPPAAPTGPQGQLQRVARPQGQPQGTQVPMPEYETVRVPGRAAGFVPHSRSAAGIPKDSQDGLMDQVEDTASIRQEGLRVQAEAEKINLEADRDAAAERAANLRIDADLAQMRAKDIQAKNQKIEEDLNKEWSALTATKVDRDRVWKDKGWGAGLLAAVGIALSEYSSKMNGGPNVAFQMIENMIDRDIEAQRQDLLTRKEGLNRKQSHYDRNVYGTEKEDLAEAKMLRWAAVEEQAKEDAANKDLTLLQPKLLELSALAAEKKMAAQAEILNMRKLQETETWDRGSAGGIAYRETARSQATGKAIAEGGKRAEALGKIQKVEAGPEADPDTVWVNGQAVGKAANAKDLNAQITAASGLRRVIGQMKELNSKGSSMFQGDEYRSLAIEAGYAYMDSIGSPVKSDADAEAAFATIGGETLAVLRPEHRNKILDGISQRADAKVQEGLSQRGIYADLNPPSEEQ